MTNKYGQLPVSLLGMSPLRLLLGLGVSVIAYIALVLALASAVGAVELVVLVLPAALIGFLVARPRRRNDQQVSRDL